MSKCGKSGLNANGGVGGVRDSGAIELDDEAVLAEADAILERRFKRGATVSTPAASGQYLKNRLARYDYEVFGALMLDTRHRVIAFKELFRGSIDGASVHPREVVRAVIEHNAAAVIFGHNHPSGVSEPSAADRSITLRLRDALALIEVRVLDHLIVGSGTPTSMAQRGMI